MPSAVVVMRTHAQREQTSKRLGYPHELRDLDAGRDTALGAGNHALGNAGTIAQLLLRHAYEQSASSEISAEKSDADRRRISVRVGHLDFVFASLDQASQFHGALTGRFFVGVRALVPGRHRPITTRATYLALSCG